MASTTSAKAMASKATPSLAFFLAFILLLFTLANAAAPPPPPPPPSPSQAAGQSDKCPIDTVKLGVCANVLNILNLHLGNPPKEPCCSLLQGLADAEVAVCLCTALKTNVLGINLNVPVNLNLLVNYCGKEAPTGFQCF